MSSEFDRDMDFFQYFHGDDQERFDFNEYCNTGDYTIDQALEAHTLDHPAADASNVFFDPDASVGVLEPNQASLHEGQSAMLPGSNQSELEHLQFKHSGITTDMAIASSGSYPPPWDICSSNTTNTAISSAAPPGPPTNAPRRIVDPRRNTKRSRSLGSTSEIPITSRCSVPGRAAHIEDLLAKSPTSTNM
ncbi:unnamed protein product [Clonostachys rosea f. rosea IK726]|uniref:Uncharacterized protein n=1 Tax=Clonostachys rosea f. rosea IK726 TaxID=1349383 RepID=A0ACA9UE87_BIOOC|nr:unnamed protein product [Clonostachys rosea f. rosea IK726]